MFSFVVVVCVIVDCGCYCVVLCVNGVRCFCAYSRFVVVVVCYGCALFVVVLWCCCGFGVGVRC